MLHPVIISDKIWTIPFWLQGERKKCEKGRKILKWYNNGNLIKVQTFFLMAYQLSWVIECQSHPCRRTTVIPPKLWVKFYDKGVQYPSQGY